MTTKPREFWITYGPVSNTLEVKVPPDQSSICYNLHVIEYSFVEQMDREFQKYTSNTLKQLAEADKELETERARSKKLRAALFEYAPKGATITFDGGAKAAEAIAEYDKNLK